MSTDKNHPFFYKPSTIIYATSATQGGKFIFLKIPHEAVGGDGLLGRFHSDRGIGEEGGVPEWWQGDQSRYFYPLVWLPCV